jgi:hypothetical protein
MATSGQEFGYPAPLVRAAESQLAATGARANNTYRRHPEEPRFLRGVSKDCRLHLRSSSFEARKSAHLRMTSQKAEKPRGLHRGFSFCSDRASVRENRQQQ